MVSLREIEQNKVIVAFPFENMALPWQVSERVRESVQLLL